MDKISEKNKMKSKSLPKLINLIKTYSLDGYAIPKNDEFFSEYADPDRLLSISNFSGSAGLSIIMIKKNYLFIDGRYLTQAKKETKNKFNIFEFPKF